MTNGTVKDHMKRYDQIIIYFVCYTLIFIIFTTTLRYTIPFVLAFIFASVLSRLIRGISSKLKIDQKYIRLPIIILFFGIIGTLVTMLAIGIANQAVRFGVAVVNYFTDNGESIMFWFNEKYHWLISQIENLDPRLIESGNQMLNSALMSIRDYFLVSWHCNRQVFGNFNYRHTIAASSHNLYCCLYFPLYSADD